MSRIVVDPITRIEGHLRIEAEIRDGKITDAIPLPVILPAVPAAPAVPVPAVPAVTAPALVPPTPTEFTAARRSVVPGSGQGLCSAWT